MPKALRYFLRFVIVLSSFVIILDPILGCAFDPKCKNDGSAQLTVCQVSNQRQLFAVGQSCFSLAVAVFVFMQFHRVAPNVAYTAVVSLSFQILSHAVPYTRGVWEKIHIACNSIAYVLTYAHHVNAAVVLFDESNILCLVYVIELLLAGAIIVVLAADTIGALTRGYYTYYAEELFGLIMYVAIQITLTHIRVKKW